MAEFKEAPPGASVGTQEPTLEALLRASAAGAGEAGIDRKALEKSARRLGIRVFRGPGQVSVGMAEEGHDRGGPQID